MTLKEILQIIGGIGVIASMIYVGIQIRNNARAMRRNLSTAQRFDNTGLAQHGA